MQSQRVFGSPVAVLLARDAVRRPGHSNQPLGSDFRATIQTGPIGSITDSSESETNVPEPASRMIHVKNGHFAVFSESNFVQRVGRAFNRDLFASLSCRHQFPGKSL